MLRTIKLLLTILISTISFSLYSQVDNSILSKGKISEEDYWDKLRVSLYTDSSYNASYDYQYYINSGLKKMQAKEYAQALDDFRRSLSILNNTTIQKTDTTIRKIPSPIFFIGVTKSLLGEPDSAKFYFRKCIQLNSSAVEAYNELGAIYLSRNMIDSALNGFMKAYKLDKNSIVTNYNIGYTYYSKWDYYNAKRYLKRAIEINPKFDLPFVILGNIFTIEDAGIRAKKYFTLAIDANPKATAGYYFRGMFLLKHNDKDLAYGDFLKVYELDSLNKSSLILLFGLDMYFDRYELGIKRLAKYLSINMDSSNPKEIENYFDSEFESVIKELNNGNLQIAEKHLGYQFFKNFVNNEWDKNRDMTFKFISINKGSLFAKRLYLLGISENNLNIITIEKLDEAIQIDTSFAMGWFIKGNKLFKKEMFNESIKCFTKAIEKTYSTTWAYYNRGFTYKFMDNHKLAIDDFNKVISLYPSFSWAYLLRGDSYEKIKDTRNAIKDSKRAIELNKDNYSTGYHILTKCYIDLNQLDSALYYSNKYIDQDSLSLNAHYAYNNRGTVYMYLKDYNKALFDFNKALNIYPNNIGSLELRGGLLFDFGYYKLSINDFTNSLNYYPRNLDISNNVFRDFPSKIDLLKKRGDVFFYNKEYDNAINDFQEAIKIKVNDSNAAKRIGDCYFEKKDIQNARKFYDLAITYDSTLSIAFYQKGLCYTKLENSDNAIQCYLKAIKTDSTYSLPFESLAHEYYRLNDFKKCIEYSQKAIKLDQRAFRAMYYIALANLRLNNFALAKRYYQIYAKMNIKMDKEYLKDAIDNLKDLINESILVNESKEILRDIFGIHL